MMVTKIAFLGFCIVLHGHFTAAGKNSTARQTKLKKLEGRLEQQESKQEEQESQLEQQEIQLKLQESQLIQQESQLKQQEGELTQLKSQLKQQTNQTQQQAEKLHELEGEVISLENDVDLNSANLKALNDKLVKQDTTVAFYARSNENIHTAVLGTLIFDHAETNVGNAYSTTTGVFTAPVSGIYCFQTTFMSNKYGSGNQAHANIYVGNKRVAMGVSDTRHGYWDQTTISSLVHVSAGQHVYVKNVNRASNFFGQLSIPYTTFSGFLLRAD